MSDQPTASAQVAHFSHTGSRQLDSLHGLRFFAAGAILFSHACNWIGGGVISGPFHPIGDAYGMFGMSLFFVLSGFVIQYNYAKLFSGMKFRWAVVDFAGARFARLFPLYIVFQFIGILLDQTIYWVFTPIKMSFFVFLGHALTITQSWFYVTANNRHILDNAFGLSWSISTEMFFYLVFPLIIAPMLWINSPKRSFLVLTVFSALTLVLFIEAYLWKDYISMWAAAVIL